MILTLRAYLFFMDPIKVNTNIMLHNIYQLLKEAEQDMKNFVDPQKLKAEVDNTLRCRITRIL